MNVTEAVVLVVEQENFKKWFGKSTLHQDGKPHTFYHGTSSDFSEFKSGTGNQWGKGLYFIRSPKIASDYASGTTSGSHARIAPSGNAAPNVVPVHLRMEKPFVMDAPLEASTVTKVKKHLGDGGKDLKDHLWQGMKNRDLHQVLHQQFLPNVDAANDVIQKSGFDGIKEKHDDSIHMVFHPNQVKSAIGNNGNYSKTSNNINESI